MKDVLTLSDKEVLEEARKLRIGYGLKNTLRYDTKRDIEIHTESVAEHVFALIYLSQYFSEHEEIGKSLDRAKLYEILLFHDFGEIKHGDVPYHWKTKAHEEQERVDAKELFEMLPPEVGTNAYERWQEYETHTSPEGKFAYAIDKIEPLFELLDPVNERTMKALKFTYEMNIAKKLRATEEFPVMKRFTEVISKDMQERGVFWEDETTNK